jgi:agmatinase
MLARTRSDGPARDVDGQGAAVAAQLLAAVMGIIARQGKG